MLGTVECHAEFVSQGGKRVGLITRERAPARRFDCTADVAPLSVPPRTQARWRPLGEASSSNSASLRTCDGVQWCKSSGGASDILRDRSGAAARRTGGDASDVRRQHDVVELEQRAVRCERFGGEHVQSGAAQPLIKMPCGRITASARASSMCFVRRVNGTWTDT
jgi:hypothetical protein